MLGEGFAALNAGRLTEAASICQQILTLDRTRVEGHFLVGLVAAEMKDLRTAASAFGSVTKLDPKHTAAWAQLARVFMRLGQPARAEKALEEAVRIGTEDAVVEDLIGVVYSLLGDQKAAKAWYARAV
ncbi:MAG TPA: tetratricopeptide repeat protein, partial [Amphiplicatus sp.]|nr:tetratricopeptide repeat protein [Amphiplicatus sp.]